MNDLAIITFKFTQPRKWKQLHFDTYRAEHVNALARACADNIRIDHRFVCFTDDPEGVECETMPAPDAVHVRGEDACYRRLKMFDPEFQRALNAQHILMLDLDAVFLGEATDITRDAMAEPLTIMCGSRWGDGRPGIGGTLCSYYNGSMVLFRAGAHPELWHDFDPNKFYDQREAYRMPNGTRPFGSDQAWYSVKLGPGVNTFGPHTGVVQHRQGVPDDARLVFFAGRKKPWHMDGAMYGAWARYAG